MDKLQRQVREFHQKVLNQPISPAAPELRDATLRARLIAEEAIETVCALVGGGTGQTVVQEMLIKVLSDRAKKKLSGPNLVEAIDGCIDTLVVTYGTLEAIGVDGEPFADEVMRSNFDKAGGPVDAFGKMGKPPGWRDADIEGVLKKVSFYNALNSLPADES
jgi:predicted HAD superfamily Cof-like phosphohydrolase